MKILLHSLYFYPDSTGVCKYSGELAEWLAGRGHDVEVLTGFPHYPEWRLSSAYKRVSYRTETWNAVKIHRVPHYIPDGGRLNTLRRVWVDLTFWLASVPKWLMLLVRREPFDVIIVVCPSLFSGIGAWLCNKLRRTPWVFHIQDFQVDAAIRLGMLKLGPLGRVLYGLENFLICRATRVAAITPAMGRRAVIKGARQSNVIDLPNWADVIGITPSATDNAFRAQLGLSPSKIVLMYSGAMGQKQGLELVLDVAQRLRAHASVYFVMAGAGPEWKRLSELANIRGLENVQFIPPQPVERLNEMLAAADIHLVIQKTEAADLVMPSKLTNILAAGRPSIATAEKGTVLHDVLEGHEAGRVVPAEDVNALEAAILALAVDRNARERMGVNARAYALGNLVKDDILMRFEKELIAMAEALQQ